MVTKTHNVVLAHHIALGGPQRRGRGSPGERVPDHDLPRTGRDREEPDSAGCGSQFRRSAHGQTGRGPGHGYRCRANRRTEGGAGRT